jgi:hypothetical protein
VSPVSPVSASHSKAVYDALKACGVRIVSAAPITRSRPNTLAAVSCSEYRPYRIERDEQKANMIR